MKCVFPAVFTEEPEGGYSVLVPDLPGCVSCGDTLADAMRMGRDAMAMWLCDAEDKDEPIPAARTMSELSYEGDSLVSLLDVDTDEYRKQNDSRAVKKTLTIPRWLNIRGEKAGINFSQVLQEALRNRLGLGEQPPAPPRPGRQT